MERKNGKTYTTGAFAKHFGVTKDTLFYYDKIQLFSPAAVDDNGYRQYTSEQLDTFWALLSMREMGVPVKELQSYFRNPSPEGLRQLAGTQLERIGSEIAKLAQIQNLLENIEEATAEAQRAVLEQVEIKEFPAECYIYSRKNEEAGATSGEQWVGDCDSFLEETGYLGSFRVGSVIALTDLQAQQFGRVERLFIRSSQQNGTLRQAGRYAVLYHKGDYESLGAVYPFLLEEIARRGFQPAGDAYEEYLITQLAVRKECDFVTKVSISVR